MCVCVCVNVYIYMHFYSHACMCVYTCKKNRSHTQTHNTNNSTPHTTRQEQHLDAPEPILCKKRNRSQEQRNKALTLAHAQTIHCTSN